MAVRRVWLVWLHQTPNAAEFYSAMRGGPLLFEGQGLLGGRWLSGVVRGAVAIKGALKRARAVRRAVAASGVWL